MERSYSMQDAIVEALFVGQPKVITDAMGTWTSSICRERVEGRAVLSKSGFAGDRVTQRYHGGPDAAVCVHLADHYRYWNTEYGLNLGAGEVGENVTLDGIAEDQVCAGDIVRLGTALVQVSGPRIPCANLARRIGRPDWVKLTIQANRTGFYSRVLEAGMVEAGNKWELVERLNHDGAISSINACAYLKLDTEYARRMLEMIGLGEWWKVQMREKLEARSEHWTNGMVL